MPSRTTSTIKITPVTNPSGMSLIPLCWHGFRCAFADLLSNDRAECDVMGILSRCASYLIDFSGEKIEIPHRNVLDAREVAMDCFCKHRRQGNA